MSTVPGDATNLLPDRHACHGCDLRLLEIIANDSLSVGPAYVNDETTERHSRMRRPSELMSRRHGIKTFGLSALLIHPVLRSMAYAAATPFDKAPRYLMFFKGGSY